ncbi:MAG: D-alanyl-D-alanine carboxypeptidase, partial [Microbacterium sp.]|nr:D-alanyl-D-alanine carboxypeptidase [Microbacterium sp.]
GSTMSLRDALATMLIPSASNYAEAVSTWAFGSQGAFLDAARRWLSAHGLTGTTIVEPTGISSRNTSTPADLLMIGKLAIAHPAIASIAATPALSLPGPGGMSNTNTLLGVNGITGLKTGNLGEDSYNLLYSATLDVGATEPLTVVGVALGGATRESVNRDVIRTLDSIRAGFQHVPLVSEGREVGSFSTPWGSTARMVVADDASIFTWSDTPITATMTTTTPKTYEDGGSEHDDGPARGRRDHHPADRVVAPDAPVRARRGVGRDTGRHATLMCSARSAPMMSAWRR